VTIIDTSVWIEHFRSANAILVALLDTGEVLGHPFVAGELALGNFRERDDTLRALRRLLKRPAPRTGK
jgi:predicted nucleic acid-binding protein